MHRQYLSCWISEEISPSTSRTLIASMRNEMSVSRIATWPDRLDGARLAHTAARIWAWARRPSFFVPPAGFIAASRMPNRLSGGCCCCCLYSAWRVWAFSTTIPWNDSSTNSRAPRASSEPAQTVLIKMDANNPNFLVKSSLCDAARLGVGAMANA